MRNARVKAANIKMNIEREIKHVDKLQVEMKIAKRNETFATSNWVSLGIDRNGNEFLVTSIDTGKVFKRISTEGSGSASRSNGG